MAIISNIRNSIQNSVGKVFNKLPDSCIASNKTISTIKKLGKEITSAENRLILGVTALMSQPFIDAHNRSVDQETRRVSVARTIAKIIAGTTTGFLIRKGAIKAVEKFSKELPKEGLPWYKSIFTSKPPPGVKLDINSLTYKQYQNAFGTLIAIIAMMVTNFAIDAPLTKFLTNRFIEKSKGGKNEGSG